MVKLPQHTFSTRSGTDCQWWAWFAPAMLYPLVYFSPLYSSDLIYLIILTLALESAVLPGIAVGSIKWLLCRKTGIVHKSRTTLYIATGFGLLVTLNVLLSNSDGFSSVIDSSDAVDRVVLAVLLIVFSINLGLALVYMNALLGFRVRNWQRKRAPRKIVGTFLPKQ